MEENGGSDPAIPAEKTLEILDADGHALTENTVKAIAKYIDPKHDPESLTFAREALLFAEEMAGAMTTEQRTAVVIERSRQEISRRNGTRRYRKTVKKGQLSIPDPIAIRRREIAMPLWNHGYTGQDVLAAVNEWLTDEGLEHTTLDVIRADKKAIVHEWEHDYDTSAPVNRASHIATLNRVKREAWAAYERLLEEPRSSTAAANYLKIAMQAEAELADIDGTRKRSQVQAEASADAEAGTQITRIFRGVSKIVIEERK